MAARLAKKKADIRRFNVASAKNCLQASLDQAGRKICPSFLFSTWVPSLHTARFEGWFGPGMSRETPNCSM